MPYKTIMLELIEARPELHEQLRRSRVLLAVMESLATALKARHEALKVELATAKPGLEPGQAASTAMEIAVREIESRLQAAFPPDGQEALSLDDAMAFVRSLTSRA